jgi:hypothetical protein
VTLLFSKKYSDSVFPFSVYLTTLPARIVVYGAALRALGRTRTIFYGATLYCLIAAVVGVSILLAGRGTLIGYLGPAIGSAVGFWASVIFLMRDIIATGRTSWRKAMDWGELCRIMAVSVAAAVCAGLAARLLVTGTFVRLAAQVKVTDTLLRLGVAGTVFVIVYLVLGVLVRAFSEDDLAYFKLPRRVYPVAAPGADGVIKP